MKLIQVRKSDLHKERKNSKEGISKGKIEIQGQSQNQTGEGREERKEKSNLA